MKVYGAYMGCKYEGGGVDKIFYKKEDCLKYLHNTAKVNSDMMIAHVLSVDNHKFYSIGEETHWTLLTTKDGYQVGHDVYVVQEYEVE